MAYLVLALGGKRTGNAATTRSLWLKSIHCLMRCH